MTQTGTLLRVDRNEAVIRLDPECPPEACASCGCCGAAKKGRDPIEIHAPRPPDANEGDRVEVDVEWPNPGVVAVVVFGIPLVLGVAGGLLAHVTGGGDGGIVLGGAGGLGIGFLAVGAIQRLAPSLRPRVLACRKKGEA